MRLGFRPGDRVRLLIDDHAFLAQGAYGTVSTKHFESERHKDAEELVVTWDDWEYSIPDDGHWIHYQKIEVI